MSETTFVPFSQQNDFLWSITQEKCYRAVGAFAGKRGGKTEVGAVGFGSLVSTDYARDWSAVEGYVNVIAAPTYDMLKRLSWKKFKAYFKDFLSHDTKSPLEMYWHDHEPDSPEASVIYGISADNPARIEGLKCSVIWIDEVFQVSEQFFLECLARTADTGGLVICTGSLGVQFVNPKLHWAYKYFKKQIDESFKCFEWPSSANPHLDPVEIERLKRILDPQSFNAMFTINWDLTPTSAVYEDFGDDNLIKGYEYNPALETYISIDWGWAHPMSCGFYQYDRKKDHVYKFDEIFGSKIDIDNLYKQILTRPWVKTVKKRRMERDPFGKMVEVEYDYITNVTDWVCDIAGNQEREQSGRSNCNHYLEKYQVDFTRRKSSILKGIALVRSYVKSSTGERRFFVDEEKCPETVSGLKRYAFPEKDGQIQNENPVKENDDSADETRYFFWNILDHYEELDPESVGVS